MDSQKTDRKELLEFILKEILVALKQGLIAILIATGIGAIISFTKETELIVSINRWLYITGVVLVLLATLPSSNLDCGYYSSAQTRAATNRRSEAFDSVFRRFIRAVMVLLIAVILEMVCD